MINLSALSKSVNCLLFVAALFTHQSVLASVKLQINIETHNTPNPSAKNIPPEISTDQEVVLADEYIAVKSEHLTTILDFKTKRRLLINNKDKTYIDYSLFDTVGTRTREFENRQRLNRMFKVDPIVQTNNALI
jgi:hypothetical protein